MKKYTKFKIATAVITALALLFCTTHLPVEAKRDKEYVAKQIRNIKIDGKLNEWERAEIVAFDELKDVGGGIPKASDFTGQGRVAWSAQEPTRIYFAVEITDDELQDVNPPDARWWEDDSVEFMFDFDNGMVRDSLVQWTLGAKVRTYPPRHQSKTLNGCSSRMEMTTSMRSLLTRRSRAATRSSRIQGSAINSKRNTD